MEAKVGMNCQMHLMSLTTMTCHLFLHFYVNLEKSPDERKMHDSLKLISHHLKDFELAQNYVFVLVWHVNADILAADSLCAAKCLKNVFFYID